MSSGKCRLGRDPDPDPKAWLELVLLGEFQRTPDHLMPLRVRNYVDCHHMDALRAGERRFGASDRLPPVLPIVIYTGRQKWTAARRVVDLVSPMAGRSPEAVDLSARQSGLFARGTDTCCLTSTGWGQTISKVTTQLRC